MSVIDPCIAPSALVSYIIEHCAHPTTLVVGGTSDQFIQQWWEADAFEREGGGGKEGKEGKEGNRGGRGGRHDQTTLLEVAVARHIRVVFVPTVAHLRGALAAFDPSASHVPAPPKTATTTASPAKLIVYNLLRLHRETSEWSAQGLGTTAAVLAEAGWRTGMHVVMAEGREGSSSGEGRESREDRQQHEKTVWSERVPVLSAGPRRQLDKAGYPSRSERIRRVFERWFVFGGLVDAEGIGEAELGSEEMAGPEEERSEPEEEPVAEPEHIAEPQDTAELQDTEQPTAHPLRTFVKDSEDEDDLSDDSLL